MTDADEQDDGPGEHDEESDLAKLKAHTAMLMEHFDSVQIFCTRCNGDGTVSATFGGGNWYARKGQVDEWILKQDAQSVDDE